MKPDTERSDQVVARVVAWHNRHPLATRITADQVHSVGVVSLPFAVQGAQVQALPPAVPEPAAALADATGPTPPAESRPATDAPPADGAASTPTDPSEAPTILDRVLAAEAGTDLAVAADGATAPLPTSSRVRWQVSSLPGRRPAWHPLAWWQRLRGRDPYRPLFTEDFISPLRPGRVARWAADHGRAQWPLEPAASQRMVMLDAALRRDGDPAPELDLHLITAAIGIGDNRLRLLMAPGAGGAVLGQRHWSRQRVAVALPVLAGLLVSVGALRQALLPPAPAAVVAAVLPASAASGAAAKPPVAQPPAAATAMMAAASEAVAARPEPAAEPAVVAASAAAEVVARAPVDSVEPRRGRVELPTLVPPLADAQRHTLRESGRALRQEPVEAVKAWALVTPLLRDRRQSERVAAQLQAVALLQPVPMRAELLPSAQGWHAVFWPFTSERDAQKIRLALADRGLKTELMEF